MTDPVVTAITKEIMKADGSMLRCQRTGQREMAQWYLGKVDGLKLALEIVQR